MEWHRTRRRPVWQPSRLSRLKAFLKDTLGRITFGRVALAIFVLPLLFYVYREVTRDVLIIDPFTVPKHFEEAGLTGEVMANRIGDTLHQIEIATQTRMKKDNLASLREEGSVPDVEIPGTKLGLKTIVDVTRAVFGVYPKHISGDIVVPVVTPTKVGSAPVQQQATVTVYLTQGRSRSAGVRVVVAADDLGLLVQSTAETALEQVNPYVLAAYRDEHGEHEKAIEIVERIIQDPSEDILHKTAACSLWGLVLEEQKKYDEAIAKYRKAIELDPKSALAYDDWGSVLDEQKKYDEAIAKYQKAIELDPKSAPAYDGWGLVLEEQKKYDEAIAKYQKAIELDPKSAPAYTAWGSVLEEQKKYDEAIAKYQKARELSGSQ
jgi:Tfp pilus assembly protein PilF